MEFGSLLAGGARRWRRDDRYRRIVDHGDRGALDPEVVVTPGIYVDTVVRIQAPQTPDAG